MKRRDFLLRSTRLAVAGGVLPAVALRARAALLDDPDAWVGTHFHLEDGSTLELLDVQHDHRDRHCAQCRLQFRVVAGTVPGEGIQVLRCATAEQALFLQPGHIGPVACINRLRGHG